MVAEDRQVAQARQIWQAIGLAPLERIDLRPLALHHALQTLLDDPPAEVSELHARWQRVAVDNPDLEALAAERICAFLKGLLFAPEAGAEEAVQPSPVTQEVGNEVKQNILTPAVPRRYGDSEPFLYWLFSSQGIRLKLQCTVALLLLVVAIGLTVREYIYRQSRTVAYSQIQQAKATQDYSHIMEGAEKFLSIVPLGEDSREAEVKTLYAEALVRWVIEYNPPPNQIELHLVRYRKFVLGSSEGTEP